MAVLLVCRLFFSPFPFLWNIFFSFLSFVLTTIRNGLEFKSMGCFFTMLTVENIHTNLLLTNKQTYEKKTQPHRHRQINKRTHKKIIKNTLMYTENEHTHAPRSTATNIHMCVSSLNNSQWLLMCRLESAKRKQIDQTAHSVLSEYPKADVPLTLCHRLPVIQGVHEKVFVVWQLNVVVFVPVDWMSEMAGEIILKIMIIRLL